MALGTISTEPPGRLGRPFTNSQHALNWQLLFNPAEWSTPDILTVWHSLLPLGGLGALWQSPEWLDHMHATNDAGRSALCVGRDLAGQVRGIAPIRIGRSKLSFGLSEYNLGRFSFRCLELLGGPPLLCEGAAAYESLFEFLHASFPECDAIKLGSVLDASAWWGYIRESPIIRQHYLTYLPAGFRSYHIVKLPATFEAYLAQYGAKKRYNLRRQVKILSCYAQKRMELVRVVMPTQVPALMASLRRMQSWNRWLRTQTCWIGEAAAQPVLTDIAARGLLRSYLLRCEDREVAGIYGLQYGDVFYLEATAFDSQFARFSPGTVLLHLLIEDLIKCTLTKWIDIGFGEPFYEHSSTNTRLQRAAVALFRKTAGNRVRLAAHAAFLATAGKLKTAAICMGLKRGTLIE